MKLVRYLDGDESTPLRTLLERHSVAESVQVPKAYEDEFLDILDSYVCDVDQEPVLPDYKGGLDKPVPLSFHVDHLNDLASDMVDEEFPGEVGQLWQLLLELATSETGMDTVYLMGDKT